jgi:hypothetical protein
MRRSFFIAFLASGLALPLSAQSTLTSGAPTEAVQTLGTDFTAVAERFQVTSNMAFLQSFTFYLMNGFLGDQLFLNAAIYSFDVDHVTGPALFTSALFAGSGDDFNWVPYTISGSPTPLNIAMAPGATYALVLSVLDGVASSTPGAGVAVGTTSDNLFSGGALMSFAGSNGELAAAGAFQDFGQNDVAFSATFTPDRVVATPEPTTLTLVATAFVGVGGVVARRRRRNT